MGAGGAWKGLTALVGAVGAVGGMLGAPVAATADVTRPFRPQESSSFLAAKREARAQGGLGRPLGPVMAPAAGPEAVVASPSLNQPGLAAGDNATRNDGTPPDPTGAVGPSHYFEFVNSVVRVYSKTNLTTIAGTADLDTFVGATNDSAFDPQIQYDPVADRWFYLADDCSTDCSAGNYLAYGWSKTNDPSDLAGGWCRFRIRTDTGAAGQTGYLDDYPKLGHNDSHLVFGTNVFDASNNFVSARIWTVSKPPAGPITDCAAGTGTPHWFSGPANAPVKDRNLALNANKLRTSDNQLAFTPVPANTQDSSPNAYVVAADAPPGNQIMVWQVSGAAGAEALTAKGNIGVSTFAMPANVPQPGSSDVLDSADTRLTQAVAHTDPDAGAEAVWTQHTINGAGGRSVVRWYELLPASLTRRQEGAVSDASSFVFNGAISPSMAGNEAVIQYNVGGSNQLAQIRARSRIGPRALGTMGDEVVLGTSAAADHDFSCPSADPANNPSCRWGDYAGATPDPSSPHLVWGTNQLIGAASGQNAHWTTRNFALMVSVEPVAAFSASPNPGYTGKPVTFDASASSAPGGTVDKYDWDFDGNGSFEATTTTPQTTHVYAAPGTFNVKLRVSSGAATDTTTASVSVGTSSPTASFTVVPGVVSRGRAVAFDGSASSDSEAPGGIASYAWDFDGDGTTDQTTTTPTVIHAYPALGSFGPRLVVTDADDGQQSAPAARMVSVQNALPTAKLAFAPASPKTGDAVTFSAAGSTDPDGSIVSHRWDFNGDGVFETDTRAHTEVTRRFTAPGRFSVAVRVQDAEGATATATTTVRVVKPAFNLVLEFSRKARLATLLRGVAGTVGCGSRCKVLLTLRIPAALARRMKTRPIIAKTTVRIRDSRAKAVRLKLTRSARKRLRGARPFTVTLTGSAVNAAKPSAKGRLTIRVRP